MVESRDEDSDTDFLKMLEGKEISSNIKGGQGIEIWLMPRTREREKRGKTTN